MPITSFTVGGAEVDPRLRSLDIRETVGGISTLSCEIESTGSPVLPFGVFDEVIVEEDGVRIFGGFTTQALARGDGGANLYDPTGAPEILTRITAEDYGRLAERITVTETVAAGTLLKTFLTTLVSSYLGPNYGVTLDGAQVNGPALPAMAFDISRGSEVLNALATATGYLWRIDYNKQLRMWLPGDLLTPFDIDEYDSPVPWHGDVEVETKLGDDFANRVIVICAPIEEESHVETFTGDGVTDTFDLDWTVLSDYGYVNGDTSVPLYQTLRRPTDPDSASWTYDPATNQLTREDGPLPLGQVMSFTFHGTFTARATAEDAASIADVGLFERVVKRTDVTTTAAAQAIADELLAQLLNSGDQTISYSTDLSAPTLHAGQQQAITATARGLSGDYIIRELQLVAEVTPNSVGGWLTRRITATKTNPLAGKYQNTYHDWLEQGRGGSVGVGAAPATVGPDPPDTSIQTNQGGRFNGEPEFTYSVPTATVMIGTGHTPGGSVNLLNGQGHTVL